MVLRFPLEILMWLQDVEDQAIRIVGRPWQRLHGLQLSSIGYPNSSEIFLYPIVPRIEYRALEPPDIALYSYNNQQMANIRM
jgi:hypothetical protein